MDGIKRTIARQNQIVDHRTPHPHGCESHHFGLRPEDLTDVPSLPEPLLMKLRANLPMTAADEAAFEDTVEQLRIAVINKHRDNNKRYE